MKNMKNVITLTLFIILTIGQVYSQNVCCPYIGDITIIPTNPTTNDSVKIVTKTITPNRGSKMSYSYAQQLDTYFDLVGYFWQGVIPGTKTFFDTTNVGVLKAGTYYINYTAYSSISVTTRLVNDTNSAKKVFMVSTPIGLENLNGGDISIYPNPFSRQTIIQTETSFHNATLIVSNLLGEVVVQIENINGGEIFFNRDNLANGLYCIQLTQDNKIMTTKKIIITD
jgi:hypothetical protein